MPLVDTLIITYICTSIFVRTYSDAENKHILYTHNVHTHHLWQEAAIF